MMRLAAMQGANTKNGFEMLQLQAEKSWEIWNV
jgi:shikimate dehydrogenase